MYNFSLRVVRSGDRGAGPNNWFLGLLYLVSPLIPSSMFYVLPLYGYILSFSIIWFYTYSNHTIHRAPWGSSFEQGGRYLTLATLDPISVQSWSQCDCLYLRCSSSNTSLLWLQKIKESIRNIWFDTVSENVKGETVACPPHHPPRCSRLVQLFENWFCKFSDCDLNMEMYLVFGQGYN